MSTYDSWLCELPGPPRIGHPETYPEAECDCGCTEWMWDSDALGWACEDCGRFLDSGRYRIYEPWELAEDARLSAAGL